MKILFVAHSSELNGGANRSLLSIVDYFSKKPGYEIEVLLPNNSGEMNNSLTEMKIKWFSIHYNTVISKNTLGISGTLRTINIFRKFVNDFLKSILIIPRISKSNYDLIYTNTRVIFIGAFIAKWIKVPHIWHVREFVYENNLKTIYNAEKIIDMYSSKIIVISNSIKKSLISKNVNPKKIKVVHNGIKIEKHQKEKKIEKEKTNVLIAGTLIPVKRQLDAVKSFKILKDKGYNNLNLYIAGTDPDSNKKNSYKNLIEDYITSSGLDNIIFLGELNNLDEIRKQTEIELMCSSNEAFGRVTIEGMQAGNILIGSNSGATPEIISHGQTGFLYEPGNSSDLAKQIEYVVSNKKELAEILKNSSKVVETNFDINKNLKQIEMMIMKEIKKD